MSTKTPAKAAHAPTPGAKHHAAATPAAVPEPLPVVVEPPPPPPITFSTGRFVYDNGATYEGGFSLEAGVKKRHGAGRFASAAFSYDGEWAGDEMHGVGTYVTASGALYAGDFARGVFSGQGIYTWTDGARYEGAWAANAMHGGGKYTAPDGVLFAGTFHNGMYVSGTTHVAVR